MLWVGGVQVTDVLYLDLPGTTAQQTVVPEVILFVRFYFVRNVLGSLMFIEMEVVAMCCIIKCLLLIFLMQL